MAEAGSWPWTGPAGDAGVAFTVVGRFAVAVDGRAVDDRQVGSAKGRRLLALLVVHRGHSVSTDRIVDALWEAEPPPRAAENVATLVSRLRRALGASVIGGVRGSYRLGDGAGIWVDIDAADELATRAQDSLRTAPAVSLAAAGQALDLAGAGDLLEGEPDAEWLHQPRLQLARLLRRTRLIYAEAALGVGEFARHVKLRKGRWPSTRSTNPCAGRSCAPCTARASPPPPSRPTSASGRCSTRNSAASRPRRPGRSIWRSCRNIRARPLTRHRNRRRHVLAVTSPWWEGMSSSAGWKTPGPMRPRGIRD